MDHEQEQPGARSVTVGGDLTGSFVVTGDNATVIENAIVLPARPQDQGPVPEESRAALLDRLIASSRGRMIAGWQAAGIRKHLAAKLADDPTIGTIPPDLADFPTGSVRVLEGHLGLGKSLLGERLHQQDIQQARLRVDGPIPVWLRARDLRESLETKVGALSRGLGDPQRVGATVVVDGLDEGGSGTAADLIEQARILVHQWPATRVLLTTRPGPGVNDDERVDAPLLSDDQADALVQRIGDGQSIERWLWRWPDEARTALRETLRTPLFASIMGTLRREGQTAPLSPAELVERLIDRGLRTAARGTESHSEKVIRDLLCRLATATIQRNGRLPLGELGSPADQAAVLASRLVAREGGTLAFPLPLVEQWFAARALLDGIADFDSIVHDLRQLDPWRWPLVMATRVGGHQPVTRLLAPLAARHPGLAGWVVHQAEESRSWTWQPTVAPPPALESGERVREAMQAWVAGLGSLTPDLAPVASDGQLQPVGVRVDGKRLTTAWYRGDDELPPIADLPLEIAPGAVQGDWWLVHVAAPGSASTWAWPWTMHDLRTRLKKRFRRRGLSPRPGGVLEHEARWRLCNGILGRSRESIRPVEIERVIAAIEDRLADVSADVVSASFMFSGIGTLSDRQLRQFADELAQCEVVTIEPPWETPDLPRGSGRWVWSNYSPGALLRRTQQVYQGALDAYAELIDHYFSAWRSTLGMAALMPLRLLGTLELTTPDTEAEGPGLFWTVMPLESGSANRVEIEFGEPRGMWPDWEAFSNWDRSRQEALRMWRPEVMPYARLSQFDGMLNVFGSRPATLLAYDWLSEDLYRLGWLNSRISNHLED